MEQELRMLLKRPGNDACADCGGPFPRFASTNLAVFLCNRCYGIHRSIGTHVTRTKTVGLDRWSPDEVHRMSSVGNVVANSYWEENAPPIFRRPNADSPNSEVEKWIRDKYERKLFCSSSREPPSVTPQVAEPLNPDGSTRRLDGPRVKLLPSGTLRCGPDCKSPSRSPGESSQALRSRRPSQPHTTGPGVPFHSNAHETAARTASEKQPELVFDDDEDFGEFVQA